MNCIKYIMKVYLFTIFFTILSITNSFKIDHFEPIIGKWKLLYSDNITKGHAACIMCRG